MSEQEPLLADPEAGTSGPDNASFTERTARHLESRAFHSFVITLIVIDSACVLADLGYTLLSHEYCPPGGGREYVKDPVWLEVLSHISTVITTLFLIEIPLQVWAFGLQYFNPLRGVCSLDSLVSVKGDPEGREARQKVTYGALHLFDACVVITTFVLEVALKGRERELAGLLVLLRLWRLVKLVGGVAVGAGEISEVEAQELVDTKQDLVNTEQALAEALEKNRILRQRLGSVVQKPDDEDDDSHS